MLARLAHVGVDQQRAFPQLRERDRQIGGDITAPFAGARTDDRQAPAAHAVIGPADQQLRAQRPQLFSTGMKWLVRDHEFAADPVIACQQMREVVLPCNCRAQVVGSDQAKPQRRFPEAEILGLLQLQNAFDVATAEFSLPRENGADAAVDLLCRLTSRLTARALSTRVQGLLMPQNPPGFVDLHDIFQGIHRHPQTGLGSTRSTPPGPLSISRSEGFHALSTPSTGTAGATSRSRRERTRRSDISIRITMPSPSMVPTTVESAIFSATLGRYGVRGAAIAFLSSAARCSLWYLALLMPAMRLRISASSFWRRARFSAN